MLYFFHDISAKSASVIEEITRMFKIRKLLSVQHTSYPATNKPTPNGRLPYNFVGFCISLEKIVKGNNSFLCVNMKDI